MQVFVYGTLRPGQVNHALIADAVTHHVRARLDQHALRAAPAAYFPYAVPHHGQAVIGDLLDLRPGTEDATLRILDALEGFTPHHPARSHYLRVDRPVTTLTDSTHGPAGTTLPAWVYLAGPTIRTDHLDLVVGGDWTTRVARAGRVGRAGRAERWP